METNDTDARVEFGATLRAARESKGLGVKSVATACHLSEEQVRGLENNESGSFYSEQYLARAARNYAEYLGVSLIARYVRTPVVAVPSDSVNVPVVPQVSSKWLLSGARLAAALSAVAAAIALALYLFTSMPRPRSGEVAPSPVSSSLASPDALNPGPSDSATVIDVSVQREDAPKKGAEKPSARAGSIDGADVGKRIGPQKPPPSLPIESTRANGRVFSDASAGNRFFVEILSDVGFTAKDSNGKLLLHGRLSASAGRRLVGTPPFSVVSTNADAVAVYYRGRKVRLAPDKDGEWRAEFGGQ